MSLRLELQKIIDKHEADGRPVTAPSVVEMARDIVSFPALNAHIWQVPEADLAREARLARAHRLLITMHVTVAETGETTRLMVHTLGTPGYQPISTIMRTPDLAAIKLRQLAEDIARARGRLRAFRSALPDDVVSDIDDALAKAEQRATSAKSDLTATEGTGA